MLSSAETFSAIRRHAFKLKDADQPPPRILIVDDEPAIVQFVGRVLRSAGYRTDLALSGAEALEVAGQADGYALLLTDLRMPAMDGLELARRLRQTDATLKVLYFTGYNNLLFEGRLTLSDDEAFLEKPCNGKALLEAVSLLLFGHVDPSPDEDTSPSP